LGVGFGAGASHGITAMFGQGRFGLPSRHLLPDCMSVLFLLSQFAFDHVRADFLSGAFKLPDGASSVTLAQLDALRQALLPAWHLLGDIDLTKRFALAEKMLVSIVTMKSEVIWLPGLEHLLRTALEWNLVLKEIGASPYWKSTLATSPDLSKAGVSVEPHRKTQSVGVGGSPLSCADVSTAAAPEMIDCETEMSDLCTDPQIAIVSSAQSCAPSVAFEVIDPSLHVLQKAVSGDHHLAPRPGILLPAQSPVDSSCLSSADLLTGQVDLNNNAPNIEPGGNFEAGSVTSVPVCSHCRWRGHLVSSCWRKGRRCLICGGDHHLNKCPKFVPRQSKRAPKCSLCGGEHLGSHCFRRGCQIAQYCNWCGRCNHTEQHCWVKQNCCLLCGSSYHSLTLCSRFVPRPLPGFPPLCTRGCSQHLNSNCESPRSE
jgi:hypothetical protein